MLKFIFVIFCLLFQNFMCYPKWKQSYFKIRNDTLNNEGKYMLGSELTLTPDEQKVDILLQKLKSDLYFPNNFYVENNFVSIQKNISEENLYKVLVSMPKGAVLHMHDMAGLDVNWIISNLTYRDNLFLCVKNNIVELKFAFKAPTTSDCTWNLLYQERKRWGADIVDQWLYNNMTMTMQDINNANSDYGKLWSAFLSKFSAITGLYTHNDTFYDFWMKTFEIWNVQDNVQYMEIRTLLYELYATNGDIYGINDLLALFEKAKSDFAKSHPTFFPPKFIITVLRSSTAQQVNDAISQTITLTKQFPNTIAGFDLVGPEDFGRPLFTFVDQILKYEGQVKFFFHAGETNWMGTEVDINLIDAVLLNTSRIGHGYAIIKHPIVEQMVRKNGVAIEICPISNQVLGLVKDLRNHPAATMIATSFPMVISSDDPALWTAQALSHDFFMTFIVLAGDQAGLKVLKKLALNSIKYSSLSNNDQRKLLAIWTMQWDIFIKKVIRKYSL